MNINFHEYDRIALNLFDTIIVKISNSIDGSLVCIKTIYLLIEYTTTLLSFTYHSKEVGHFPKDPACWEATPFANCTIILKSLEVGMVATFSYLLM